MCRVCPDSPLMNVSRQVVELVGDELVQPESAELLALFEEPPELLGTAKRETMKSYSTGLDQRRSVALYVPRGT